MAADIAITNSATALSANWSAASDTNSAIAKYWYAIGTTAGATDVVNWTDNWFNRTVTHTGLTLVDGQTYYFSVKAENGAGLISAVYTSNGQTVDLTPTSIANTTNETAINIYPNPFTNATTLTFSLTENAIVKIELVDVLGKQIQLYSNKNQSVGKHQIAINANELGLSKGMYFLKLMVNEEVTTTKVILK